MNTKLTVGLIATVVWITAIIGKHFWPDIDVAGLITMATGALTGLGVLHLNQKDSPQ